MTEPTCANCGHTMYAHCPEPAAVEAILRQCDVDLNNPTWPCLVCNCKTWKSE